MTVQTVTSQNSGYSLLVSYALRGLQNCWLPDLERWSHCYHLDGRASPNQSIPESDVFYSLNVLLGMSRLSDRDQLPYDLPATFEQCAQLLLELPVKTYAYGMALWCAAELACPLPGEVEGHIFALLEDRDNWKAFCAQDIGMMLTGLATQVKAGNRRGEHLIEPLFEFMLDNYACPSGLFFDSPKSWRRSFASFATQTYLTIACYNIGEVTGDRRALALADACVAKLIALQGPLGEWPWFYHVPSGKVVDFYEVYSVHQDGMAPAFLEHAERRGVTGARDALLRGFDWVYGANQLGVSMLRPESGMIIRSQLRNGEHRGRAKRLLRSSYHALASPSQGLVEPGELTLRLECRSYHLGWVLWSFGARTDVPTITHNPALIKSSSAKLVKAA